MRDIIEELREVLPPVFAASKLDELTGGAIHWPTLQNKRSRKEVPPDCFVYQGARVLAVRDKLLDWWGSTLTTSPSRGPHSKAA